MTHLFLNVLQVIKNTQLPSLLHYPVGSLEEIINSDFCFVFEAFKFDRVMA